MKRTIIINLLLVVALNLSAQNSIETILSKIEKNNTTLIALKKSAEAETI